MRDDIYDTRPEGESYRLERVTRAWVPTWLWSVFCRQNLATWQPFKSMLTRKVTQSDLDAIQEQE